MGKISIDYVVSFSSQDEKYRANNLKNGDGYKKWLTSTSDKSGQAQTTLQLQKHTILSYIDLGTIWCANIEIQVGRSEWPQDKSYATLVPTCSLMTPKDCILEQNYNITRMFGHGDFASDIAKQKWDRIRIICRQPFKKNVQIGLSFIRLRSPDATGLDINKPEVKSVQSIQNHFFGKPEQSDKKVESLKSKLVKIAGSSENGVEKEGSLNRNAKLVLAATGNVKKIPPKMSSPPNVTTVPKLKAGQIAKNENSSDSLKLKLVQISGSPVNSKDKEGTLNRNAKLVLAATGSVQNYSVPPQIPLPSNAPSKSKLYSSHLAQKSSPLFEEEVMCFLDDYEFKAEELDKITIADIRHKFEKKKKRKLTSEEKKTFIRLCEEYICEIFMEKETTENDKIKDDQESTTSPFHEKNINKQIKTAQNSNAVNSCTKENSFTNLNENHGFGPIKALNETSRSKQAQLRHRVQSLGIRQSETGSSDEWLNCMNMIKSPESKQSNFMGLSKGGSIKRKRNDSATKPSAKDTPGSKCRKVVTNKVENGTPQKIQTGKNRSLKDDKGTPLNTCHSSANAGQFNTTGLSSDSENGYSRKDIHTFEEYTLDSPSAFVECPICQQQYSQDTIEVHAAFCCEMNILVH